MSIALRYTVRSDVGLLRDGNEDSAYAGPHLLAIADGMGGHAAGEVASAVAIATLAPLDADTSGIDMLQALADAIADANAELRQITLADPATEGMGTTLTALLWSGDEAALCHIGDSRGYLLRDGVFQQITHDHTLVQSLVDEGKLTPEAAASHPQRSLVMRALQSSVPAEPDLAMLKAKVGDRYLLCSDGLSDVVSDETVHKTLAEFTDLDEAVAKLIDLAIRSGGPDNITCVLADVIDTESGLTPTQDVIVVGALTGGADQPIQPVRSDSPAARAHLLTTGQTGLAGATVADAGTGTDADTGTGTDADVGAHPGFAAREAAAGRARADQAAAAALARGLRCAAHAARGGHRRGPVRLAGHPGRVLRRHRRREGRGVPRREPGGRGDHAVQHGRADRHPDHRRAQWRGRPDPGDHPGGEPAQGAPDRVADQAGLPVHGRADRDQAVGGAPAEDDGRAHSAGRAQSVGRAVRPDDRQADVGSACRAPAGHALSQPGRQAHLGEPGERIGPVRPDGQDRPDEQDRAGGPDRRARRQAAGRVVGFVSAQAGAAAVLLRFPGSRRMSTVPEARQTSTAPEARQ